MSRRIEVELTSARPDGSWTWRAAGAREPRGVIEGELAASGGQGRRRVQGRGRHRPRRHLGPARHRGQGAPRRARAARAASGRRSRSSLSSRHWRPSSAATARRAAIVRRAPATAMTPTRGARVRDASHEPQRPRPSARSTGRRSSRGIGEAAGDATATPAGETRPVSSAAHAHSPSAESGAPRSPARREPKPKPKRLRAGRTHRKALLASLPPEQVPVAEQLLAGGLPAVRQAIVTQNTALKAEGKPEVPSKSLIGLAEQMLPQVRAAEWRDRAEAALADVDEIDLRDLRSVVGADDAARDEESRALAAQLREALTARVEKEHAEWLAEIGTALDEARVVRALRLSTRPPKAGARFPAAARDPARRVRGRVAARDRRRPIAGSQCSRPSRSRPCAARWWRPACRRRCPTSSKAAITRSAGALPQIAAQFGIEPPAVTGPAEAAPADAAAPTGEAGRISDAGRRRCRDRRAGCRRPPTGTAARPCAEVAPSASDRSRSRRAAPEPRSRRRRPRPTAEAPRAVEAGTGRGRSRGTDGRGRAQRRPSPTVEAERRAERPSPKSRHRAETPVEREPVAVRRRPARRSSQRGGCRTRTA